MRRIISENGMSLKLVQHCNESDIFFKEFIKLFDNFKVDNIDYIQFTGDNGVGKSKLKPDITIRYNNGEKAYIEVKTNKNTCYQKSQTENSDNEERENETEKINYIELLKDENRGIVGNKVENIDFIQSHLAYLLDKEHYEQAIKEDNKERENKLTLQKVSWNEVYDKVLQFGYRDFGRDIKENVDGIIKDEEEITFTPYDIALLYNSRLFNEKIKIFQNINYEEIKELIIKDKLHNILEINIEDYMTYNNDRNHLILNKDEFKEVFYNLRMNNDYSMYYGWECEILEEKIIYKTEGSKIEDYLYSFAIDKELLNINKLQEDKVRYLEDENRWVYFPIKNEYLPPINSTTDFCRASNDIEQIRLDKLNICKSIICLNKMQKLFKKSESIIVDKINKENKGKKKEYDFICGKGFNNNSYFYIDVKDKEEKVIEDLICYGIMQNAFDKDFTEEKNIIPSDYFLSVCFNINKIKDELNIKPIEKEYSVIDENDWIYYPICRMTLCKENYLEAFSDKVVSIIKDVLSL